MLYRWIGHTAVGPTRYLHTFLISVLISSGFSVAAGPVVSSAARCDTMTDRSGLVSAHPEVTGAAGPFSHVRVRLDHLADPPDSAFTGRMIVDGPPARCFVLSGPDAPNDFFLFDVRSILFTPLDQSRHNGIVVLYNQSQIGPGNGTQQRAIVYRVSAAGAVRDAALEARLAGAATAAAVRARLKKATR